jgi:BirA family biotin operon repressor/biotin-[acetyl-CoA-carboxylase] ligase
MNTVTNPSPPRQAPAALTFTLLRLLADGKFHSGEKLAHLLGISRASVSNALRGMDYYGLKLFSVKGRGYCLSNPPQWLDAKRIIQEMGDRKTNFSIEIMDSAVSSNTLLLNRSKRDATAADLPGGSVLAVEWQSAGRGRLGRTWHSGLGNALTFSLLWRFNTGLAALSGLSLAAGVAMIRALRVLGITNAQLKWPNDVLGNQGKLAGILIEAQGDVLGPSVVVIGIGINLSLQQQVLRRIDQPVTSLELLVLESGIKCQMPERNKLLAIILLELETVLGEFSEYGFSSLRDEWQRYHALHNQPVKLLMPDGSQISGIVRGVSEEGALELESNHEIRKFNAGEVSLRSALNAID